MESYKNQFYPTAEVVRIGQTPGIAKYIVNVTYQTHCISDNKNNVLPLLWHLIQTSPLLSNAHHKRPRGNKIIFMLNSAELKIFLFIDVKMQTIVGILTCMNSKNSILGLSEHEKC